MDSACCTAAAAALLLTNVSSGASSLSQQHLTCFRTPVPGASCALTLPTRFMCCMGGEEYHARAARFHGMNHSGTLGLSAALPRARSYSLEEVSRDLCKCAAPQPEAAAALRASETQLASQPSNESGPLCTVDGGEVSCRHRTIVVAEREVHFQLPQTARPAGGFPAVVLFHCWGHAAETAFQGSLDKEWDSHAQKANTTMALLDAGFAVIAPSASSLG